MYVAAQWVVSPAGVEGVNAFCYGHGPIDWSDFPPDGIPYANPGTLVDEAVVVPPPGNRVRAYLDLAVPDGTAWAEVQHELIAFVAATNGEPLPWEGINGRSFFKLEMERDLASDWRESLATLIEAARRVWPAAP